MLLKQNSYCDAFETNFVLFRFVKISFGNLAIKGAMGGGSWNETYLLFIIWDIEDLVHCQFCILQS